MNKMRKKKSEFIASAAAERKEMEKLGFEYIGTVDDFTIPKWWECGWRRVPCGKDSCRLCGRINKDRARHIAVGENPDDARSVFEDVSNNLKEALTMIKKDAAARGIDITNIADIKEPPGPEEFPLYKKVDKWHKGISELVKDAEQTDSLWLLTEAAEDLLWYKNTVLAKTYRQLSNRWHLKQGDGYGDIDYQYTGYVLTECLNILDRRLRELSSLASPQKAELMVALPRLMDLKKKILKI